MFGDFLNKTKYFRLQLSEEIILREMRVLKETGDQPETDVRPQKMQI